MFSSMCAICVVPGMGTIQGFCAVSQRDLGGRGTRPFGPALDQFDQRHVVLQVLRRESGLDAAETDALLGGNAARLLGVATSPV